MNPTHEPPSPGGDAARPESSPHSDAVPPEAPAPPPDSYVGGYGPLAGEPPPQVGDGYGWDAGFDDRPPRRPLRRSLVVGASTVLAVAAAGVPFGLLWAWLAPTVPVGRTRSGDIIVTDPSPEQFVAADGWFTLLGFGFGVLAAIAVWLIVRRHRGPVLLVSVVLGALGAAGVAWQLGRRLGLGAYERWQETAVAGATFHRPPDLHAHGPLLVPAFGAVIVTTLLAGWASDPDLSAPDARPEPFDHQSEPYGGPEAYGVSSDSPVAPDPTAAPAPPGPGPAGPPHG